MATWGLGPLPNLVVYQPFPSRSSVLCIEIHMYYLTGELSYDQAMDKRPIDIIKDDFSRVIGIAVSLTEP
jgi:hypothetical protein